MFVKDYPNLVTMWETVDCIAERCTVCRARWFTDFKAGKFGGVRTRLRTTEDGMLSWPEKLCDDCAEINAELEIIVLEIIMEE